MTQQRCCAKYTRSGRVACAAASVLRTNAAPARLRLVKQEDETRAPASAPALPGCGEHASTWASRALSAGPAPAAFSSPWVAGPPSPSGATLWRPEQRGDVSAWNCLSGRTARRRPRGLVTEAFRYRRSQFVCLLAVAPCYTGLAWLAKAKEGALENCVAFPNESNSTDD